MAEVFGTKWAWSS